MDPWAYQMAPAGFRWRRMCGFDGSDSTRRCVLLTLHVGARRSRSAVCRRFLKRRTRLVAAVPSCGARGAVGPHSGGVTAIAVV